MKLMFEKVICDEKGNDTVNLLAFASLVYAGEIDIPEFKY
jgi:hypothetical protein